MDRHDKDIVEHSIYKLKGIAGILDVLASEEPVGIRDETQSDWYRRSRRKDPYL